jgi:beta-lactamase regulating signal transducer with metallopeptidase domain
MSTLFLEMHLLLAGTLGVFLALKRLPLSPTQRMRQGQLLILMALAAPLLVSSVPRERLPALNVAGMFRPAPEDSGAAGHRPVRRRARPAESPPESEAATAAPLLDADRLAALALAFALLLSAFAFGRVARDFTRLRRGLREALEIRRLGRVSILVSDTVTIPFSTRAAFRAHVVLPSAMLGNPRDFRIAIRHELQHHRQSDTLWALFFEAVACFFYINPCVHRWRREITETQELSCDAALLGRKGITSRDYGSCLVRVAETALGAKTMLAGTACMAADPGNPAYFKSFLKRRIEMVMKRETPRRRVRLGVMAGTLASITTIALAFGSQQALRGPDPDAVNPGAVIVDARMQAIAERALARGIERTRAKSGYAIVTDPDTGRVLAVAGIDRTAKRPAFWPLAVRVEPASIAKGIVAAAAVEHGVTTVDEKFNCENGNYVLGDRTYHDWKAFGELTTTEAVAKSSNICGIKIGERLGAGGLAKAFGDFGFGDGGSASAFPQARPGVIPRPESMHATRYIPLITTGYAGFLTTPLEILMAYGAIANGGNLMRPQQADASEAVVVRRVLSQENARRMREVLAEVVNHGTAESISKSPIPIAGKTATAYHPTHPDHEKLGGEASVASFVGFAPANNPKIAVYVGIDHPTSTASPTGSVHAAPVVREIIEAAL